MRSWKSQVAIVFVLMSVVLTAGTLGFQMVEGWSLFDSFYMTLITLTTVGYEEVHPLTFNGRVFASVLMLAGVTTILASITILGDMMLKLELADAFGRRRRKKMLKKLSGHYIVCGAGRVGRSVVRELKRNRAKILLIESDPERAKWGMEQEVPTLVADATQDSTLRDASIETAVGLVSAMASDAQNVYVTLSARVLNPKLLIASRASTQDAEDRLRRAGANTAFTPYSFIGHRLAQSMLRPHVLSFLDLASAFGREAHLDIEIEEVLVSSTSAVASKTLEESQIRASFGVIILAIKKSDGAMQFNPPGSAKVEPDDVLIAMGERSNLKKLEDQVEA
ncbi:MAG: potassium channel protein [Acidobacteria bacterium]|nr:potassium channel protein [Acidobacteriota bacterium]